MPYNIIAQVNDLGVRQGIPATLASCDRHAKKIRDTLDDILHDDDYSSYAPYKYFDTAKT